MAAVKRPAWKVAKLAQGSSLTGEPFAPDTPIVTALFGEETEVGEDGVKGIGFVRKDFLESEATDEILADAYCQWRTRTPPADPAKERRLDLGMARQFLERLLAEGDPEKAAVCLTLALLLLRKRKLTLVEETGEAMKMRWPREKETFLVPAPVVTAAEAEVLQQDLQRLFEIG